MTFPNYANSAAVHFSSTFKVQQFKALDSNPSMGRLLCSYAHSVNTWVELLLQGNDRQENNTFQINKFICFRRLFKQFEKFKFNAFSYLLQDSVKVREIKTMKISTLYV